MPASTPSLVFSLLEMGKGFFNGKMSVRIFPLKKPDYLQCLSIVEPVEWAFQVRFTL
jgi:hypothetical protein